MEGDIFYLYIIRRLSYSTSAHVYHKKIHAEMTEVLQVKDYSFIFTDAHAFLHAFSHPLIKYSYNLTNKSYKMVDNKSTTSLITHTQKKIYITH